MICMLIGAAVGFYLFKSYDTAIAPHFGTTTAQNVMLISIATGAVVYVLLRLLVNMMIGTALFVGFASLFGKGGGVGIVGALVSLVPSAVLVWITAMVARLTGAVGDLEFTKEAVLLEEGTLKPDVSFAADLADWFDQGKLAGFFDSTDPVATSNHRKLARLLLIFQDQQAWSRLQSDPRTFWLAKSPVINDLIAREDIQEMIANGRHDALLNSKLVAEAAKDPSLKEALEETDLRSIVDDVLYKDTVRRGRLIRPRNY